MWEVRDKFSDEVLNYDNSISNLRLYIKGRNRFDTPKILYRIQEDPLVYEEYSIIWPKRQFVPSALTISCKENSTECKGNCSDILKVYVGIKKGPIDDCSIIIKWWLIYERNGDVPNNSEFTLVNPDMNYDKTLNHIRIHYDYRNITHRLLETNVNVFAFVTIHLKTVQNNKRLKLSSESEKFAIESGNEKKFDYFSILPNEIIEKIFGYLDLKSLARTAQICSRFNDFITKTDNFYFNLDFKPYWKVFNTDGFDRFMKKTKNLKKLNLSWCDQDRNKYYNPKLKKFLNGAKNTLTHLYIGGDPFALKYSVIKAIFACQELLELHLRNTEIVLSHFKWFNADIIQFKNLRKLDFTDTYIEDFEALITIISKTTKLKHLILDSFNTYHSVCFVLQKLVEFDINLETWSAQDTRFRTLNLPLFEFHTNLEELDLSYCDLTLYPETFSLNFLTKCSQLKRLGLAKWKDIKDEHLVTVVKNCKKLEQVNFSSLKLITAKIISEFLELENLKFINITNCTHETISLSQIKEWQNEFAHVQIWSHLE